MNCCNDFGQCKQGHGCPVRQACHLPLDQDNPRQWIGRALDVLMVVTIAGFLCWLLGVFGPGLDTTPPTEEQTQAQREFKRDMAAAKLCREQHGEAGFTWTAAGELVCIPRHGKKVLASNP